MRRYSLGLSLLVVVSACQKPDQQQAAADSTAFTGMTVSDSFRTPESVLYDQAGDVYLVSNINGTPLTKDNNGFISRVTPEGRVDSLHFIQGGRGGVTLHAPKGMGIRGDTLFVADIDELRMFHRSTGASLGSAPVRGATFLNDLDVGPDGSVWFTDSGLKADFSPSGTEAVWHRDPASGALHAIVRGPGLGGPNGILADSGGAYVNTFGTGEVYHVTMRGERHVLGKPAGGLDGMVRLGDGTFVVSSWADSSLHGMKAGDSTHTKLITGIVSPADFGLDTRRQRFLIPVFEQNRVEIRPVAPATAHPQ